MDMDFIQIRMKITILDFLKIILKMDKVNKIIKMVGFVKEVGLKAYLLKVYLNIRMVMFIKESFLMVKGMAKASIVGQMGIFMMGIG